MSLIRVKTPGYFGREVDEGRLARFIRPGLPMDPEGPGEITDWSVVPGVDNGTLVITFGMPLPSAGDAAYYGDGAGEILDLLWRVAGGDAVSIGANYADSFTVDASAWEGETVNVSVAAVATAGTGPWSDAQAAAVPGVPLAAPVNTVQPTISGTADVGQVLTVTPGTWTGHPTPVLTYEWLRDGVEIAGETGTTYTTVEADRETTITVRETGTNSQGSASVTSSNGIAIPAEPVGNWILITGEWNDAGEWDDSETWKDAA